MQEEERRVLEGLWDEFHQRLCRFICSRMPDEGDAEDILQDVFLRIHSNLGSVRDMQRLEGWMYQIARNAIADYYRAGRRFQPLRETAVDGDFPEEDTALSLAPYLRQVVEGLPEAYRQALLLTDYAGLSQVELAQRLGISVSGAKSRVQRARRMVKDVLLNCCHFEFDARGIVLQYREHCCCCAEEDGRS